MMTIDDPGDVLAVLTDDGCPVPPVPAAGGTGVAWLRSHVVRFSSGAEHRRRRSLVEAALRGVSPERLRQRAGRTPHAPVLALAEALGVPGIRPGAVAEVAAAYQPHHDVTPAADAAVGELVAACGGVPDERTAATICLLVQAHRATADLVDGALRHGTPVEQTVRLAPPVRSTRRLRAGELVEVDLATVPFGAGAHACPGRQHALALAAGALDARRERRGTGG